LVETHGNSFSKYSRYEMGEMTEDSVSECGRTGSLKGAVRRFRG
jgi:hypothetical protein